MPFQKGCGERTDQSQSDACPPHPLSHTIDMAFSDWCCHLWCGMTIDRYLMTRLSLQVISLLRVTSCIVDSAAINIMVVEFRNTSWPPPPQLSLHIRAELSSNSNCTRPYIAERTQNAVYIVSCLWEWPYKVFQRSEPIVLVILKSACFLIHALLPRDLKARGLKSAR
jgi:hypothetical protein